MSENISALLARIAVLERRVKRAHDRTAYQKHRAELWRTRALRLARGGKWNA